jgi:predicted O-methyltransferase YrrM
MDYKAVAAKVDGIPHMSRRQGRRIYDHVRATRPASVLELGTANAVGTSYIAAALEENRHGQVTSVDHASASYEPGPEQVVAEVGLGARVELIRNPDTTYNWWLKKQIAARSDSVGNTNPVYDFVFLDGAHEWNIDGLAVLLIERLLNPGGWLLLDDMNWTFAASPSYAASPAALPRGLSEEELHEPHIRAVFELLLKPHPAFSEFRDEDGWGWARKGPGAPRRLTLVTETATRPLSLARLARGKFAPRRRRLPRRARKNAPAG